MTLLLLFLLFLMAVTVYELYVLFACVSGAPFVPTPKKVVRQMIACADIRPGEIVIDVGSGDGRLVFAAADCGARAIGIEINPVLYWWSRLRLFLQRRKYREVIFQRRNFWHTNISQADVIMLYCVPGKMARLMRKLQREMKPGARVVSHAFTFQKWPCIKNDGTVYMYQRN